MHTRNISIVGLGYVGLPVAVAFGKQARTIGFDINKDRLIELRNGIDRTNEVNASDLASSNILFTSDVQILSEADFHIVAVPTPVNAERQPDLTPVKKASETVGRALKEGDIVVYESTVYPGVTEEICVPILEQVSGLKCGIGFTVGYSPERINPGDKEHTFDKITKVVAGQDLATLEVVATVYESVVTAGVYRAANIKVAEAAKVIENTQRDLNIALMNELSLIFNRMGIDTNCVLEAAGTKWNFLPFKPGLVGGHCIGVDPYYLTYKAEALGYDPEVILAGRRINDGMGAYIGQQTVEQLIDLGHELKKCTVTVLGLTFKENCPDLRNSKVIDVIRELQSFGITVQACDPQADADEAVKEYGVQLTPFGQLRPAEAIVVAVAHKEFVGLGVNDFLNILKTNPVVMDIKGVCRQTIFMETDIRLWRL
jgi:UDP-N-acetyl-D-glucosamine/UDP-N-acetyl-D-galactosamine dehydrogenase